MSISDNKVFWLNKVGVIFSPKGDKGFYTRGASAECVMDATLTELVYNKEFDKARDYIVKNYPGTIIENIEDLEMAWVHRGVEFTIVEVDGRERILYKSRINWLNSENETEGY